MKKLLITTLFLTFIGLSANAEVDKFVSSTKYNVKTSPIAQMMENATKRAMKNENKQQNVRNNRQRPQRAQRPQRTYTRHKQPAQPQMPEPQQQYNQPQQPKSSSGWT